MIFSRSLPRSPFIVVGFSLLSHSISHSTLSLAPITQSTHTYAVINTHCVCILLQTYVYMLIIIHLNGFVKLTGHTDFPHPISTLWKWLGKNRSDSGPRRMQRTHICALLRFSFFYTHWYWSLCVYSFNLYPSQLDTLTTSIHISILF